MSKKKTTDGTEVPNSITLGSRDPFEIGKDILKKYGQSVMKRGSQIIEAKTRIIGVSPNIDIALGGGVPEGCFVLLAGDPKCGKTVTALMLCKNAIDQGRNVYFLNVEGRLKRRDLLGIKGLDPDKMIVLGSYLEDEEDGKGGKVNGKILRGEEWIAIAEHFIHNDPGCVVVVDSFSQIATEKEFDVDPGEIAGDGGYRLLAQFTKRVATVLPVNKVTVVGIQHLIANTRAKMNQKKKGRSGGRKIGYAVDVDLECTHIELLKASSAEDADVVGQTVNWVTKSTAIVAPHKKIASIIRYGTGIDEVYELMDLGIQTGFIAGTGWYRLDYMRDHMDVLKEWGIEEWKEDKNGKLVDTALKDLIQIQGKENLCQHLRENPKLVSILKTEIYTMLGMEE